MTKNRDSPRHPSSSPHQRRLTNAPHRPQEIGVLQTLATMNEFNEKNKALKAVPRRKQAARVVTVVRRSDRIQRNPAPASLSEESMFKSLGFVVPRAPVSGTRGSNLGVRRQGGRIYDSENGVTCHWCRQKTLEDHVVCSSDECSGGSKLPVSFCRMCLWNRHGENVFDAIASGTWVCPKCRGGCGEGCTSCCNCGPCRKKNGLAPTHQMVKLARMSGFDNVHDYLIHQRTGESASKISKRKFEFDWGQWLLGEPVEEELGEPVEEVENENENEKVVETVTEAQAVEAAQMASPARKRARTSKASEKNAAVSIKKSATNLRTAMVVVDDLETPAKTTPMAIRRSSRSAAARGLSMAGC